MAENGVEEQAPELAEDEQMEAQEEQPVPNDEPAEEEKAGEAAQA